MRDVRRFVRAGLALSFCFMLGFVAAVVAPVFFRASFPAPRPSPAFSPAQTEPAPSTDAEHTGKPQGQAGAKPAARPEVSRATVAVKPTAPAATRPAAPSEETPAPAPVQVFPKPQGAADFAWPVQGTVTAPFGWRRDPVFSDFRFHPGVDLAARAGQTVTAAYSGRVTAVTRAGQDYGREPAGWEVTIEHPAGWTTRYRFAGETSVPAGVNILKGQSLGKLTAGGSLHFALYRDGRPVEPVSPR